MSYYYGHETYFDESIGQSRYADTHEPIAVPSKRPCPQCHKLPTPEGHDACLGTIPGALNACCGHGVQSGYVQWVKPDTAEVEIELPRWACLVLRLFGYGSVVSDIQPLTVGLRYYYDSDVFPVDMAVSGD